MHYVDEGSQDASPVLCLHGQPTWSYLFRHVIRLLTVRGYRVIASDHIGFGKSETPAAMPYTLQQHVKNLNALVRALDLRDITLVMHDWGGPIGTGLALAEPERIARLVIINSVMELGDNPEINALLEKNAAKAAYFRSMSRLYREDVIDTVLGHLGLAISGLMIGLQGLVRTTIVDDTWLRAYTAPFCTPAESLGAIAFPKSIVAQTIEPHQADAQALAAVKGKPAICIYGMQDRVLLPDYVIPAFEITFPGAPIHRLAQAGHFSPEDDPETITALIDGFVSKETG
jgi:haloalkane dehalogenase